LRFVPNRQRSQIALRKGKVHTAVAFFSFSNQLVGQGRPPSGGGKIERKKKFLVHEICTLYKMKGKNMDVSDLTSMLDISKSLIEKSTKK